MPDAAQEDIMQAAGILASLDVLIATTDLEGHASDVMLSSTIDAARDCIDRAIARMSPDSIEGVRYRRVFAMETSHVTSASATRI